jgi:hypothetical protein
MSHGFKHHVPWQRAETFTTAEIRRDWTSRTIITFEQWKQNTRFNELWFSDLQIDIATSECYRDRREGTSQADFLGGWETRFRNQPAVRTTTKRTEEEEDQKDIWDISMDETKVDIPNISGELEGGEAGMQAKGTTDGEVVIESLNGPIITAVEGAWEGAFAGVFEGAVEGDMELVGTGTMVGTDELSGKVTEPERNITLNGVEGTVQAQKGRAVWTMRPRFSRVEDMVSEANGTGRGDYNAMGRVNTGTMVWAFLYKAPSYVDPVRVGDVAIGTVDVSAVDGDRWLVDCGRSVVGQTICLRKRNIHMRRREQMWLLIIIGQRLPGEQSSPEMDLVHIAVGMKQRCENY